MPVFRACTSLSKAVRFVPSGFVIAHQYSSRACVQPGSDIVHSVITPIQGAQFFAAHWYAPTR